MSPGQIFEQNHYQVAIVGGGIAGLTLALAFERLNIKYALFEARESLAPNEGASVGLLPNGLRILEQLDLLEEVEKHTAPLKTWKHYDRDGSVLSTVNALGYYPSKTGYGGLFLPRQQVLQVMADKLKLLDQVWTSCRVTSIEEFPEFVRLETQDGMCVTADMVVGADGVRSTVRRFIDQKVLSDPLHAPQTECMSARFACVYGISEPLAGIQEGDCFSYYREQAAILGFTGKNGVIFWFVFEDLGKTVSLHDCPRFGAKDIYALCYSVGDLTVAPGLRFADIFQNRRIAMKIALEEGIAETWHTDRAVILGDAAHKMVPNAAMGANQAMESAAVLVNELRRAFDALASDRLSSTDLRQAFASFTNQRRPRTTQVESKAGMLCRAQLLHDGPAAAIVEELPSLSDGDWLFRGFMGLAQSPVLDGIPLSSCSLRFQAAMQKFMQKFKAQQAGELSCSNNGLFDLV